MSNKVKSDNVPKIVVFSLQINNNLFDISKNNLVMIVKLRQHRKYFLLVFIRECGELLNK